MREALERIREDGLAALDRCEGPDALEAVRVRLLGKKGELTAVLRGMRDVDPADRREIGELVNSVKAEFERRISEIAATLEARSLERSLVEERIDVTVPGARFPRGRLHPLTQTMEDAIAIFSRMGFEVAEGPEIETDYYNFEALKIPADHPARDMQDTLFVEGEGILRTHTSPVQIRVMESREPPLQVIAPGAVFRHDDDATHSPMFHQLEGFLVDRRVTLGDLKGVLSEYLRATFGSETAVRFRPSFFPFTEPSAEVDIGCFLCRNGSSGAPCPVCRGSGWIEILGCGSIDPNVFRAVGYDPEVWSGFAFGLGIERVAMLRHGIPNIRLFFENDLRFLRQF